MAISNHHYLFLLTICITIVCFIGCQAQAKPKEYVGRFSDCRKPNVEDGGSNEDSVYDNGTKKEPVSDTPKNRETSKNNVSCAIVYQTDSCSDEHNQKLPSFYDPRDMEIDAEMMIKLHPNSSELIAADGSGQAGDSPNKMGGKATTSGSDLDAVSNGESSVSSSGRKLVGSNVPELSPASPPGRAEPSSPGQGGSSLQDSGPVSVSGSRRPSVGESRPSCALGRVKPCSPGRGQPRLSDSGPSSVSGSRGSSVGESRPTSAPGRGRPKLSGLGSSSVSGSRGPSVGESRSTNSPGRVKPSSPGQDGSSLQDSGPVSNLSSQEPSFSGSVRASSASLPGANSSTSSSSSSTNSGFVTLIPGEDEQSIIFNQRISRLHEEYLTIINILLQHIHTERSNHVSRPLTRTWHPTGYSEPPCKARPVYYYLRRLDGIASQLITISREYFNKRGIDLNPFGVTEGAKALERLLSSLEHEILNNDDGHRRTVWHRAAELVASSLGVKSPTSSSKGSIEFSDSTKKLPGTRTVMFLLHTLRNFFDKFVNNIQETIRRFGQKRCHIR